MSKRAFIFTFLLSLALLSPAWAQEGPVATAPIPPPVKAAPEKPLLVPAKPSAEAKPSTAPKPEAAAHPAPPKAAAQAKEASRPRRSAPPTLAVRPPAKSEKKDEKKTADKAEKKKKAEMPTRIAARRRVAVERRWVMRREPRWQPPPPPFGGSWYERYGRGPVAYAPYGGGMRVPPPMPWDE